MAVQSCNTWYVVYAFIILAHPIIMVSYISCTSGWFRWFTDAIEDLPHSRHQDRHKKKLLVSYVIISFKTATRGVAPKNAWSVQPTVCHQIASSKNGNIQNLRKKWRDKNWINRIGLKRCCFSLSLSFSLFRVQHLLKSKPLSGTWHQRSQHYMNHHEPSCSNLSWKKISLPVQCPALPPWYPWYQPGFGMDLGPFLCGRAQESQFIGRSVSAIVVAIFIIQVVGIGPWHHHQEVEGNNEGCNQLLVDGSEIRQTHQLSVG